MSSCFLFREEKKMKRSIVLALVAATLMPASLAFGQFFGDRVGYSHKADLFVFPFVRIRWNGSTVKEDTFISFVNDDTSERRMYMYFVDGRTWVNADRTLDLTGNQASYFSAYSGTGGNTTVPSFRALNSAGRDATAAPYPDTTTCGSGGDRVLDGFIVAWTADQNNKPVCTNHIAASATVVVYDKENAWEYKPWGFRSNSCMTSSNHSGSASDPPLGTWPNAGLHELDGSEYQKCPSQLLVDFWATGGDGFGAGTTTDFEISLVNMALDLRDIPDHDMDGTPGEQASPSDMTNAQDDKGPYPTAVSVLTWNEIESQVSNTVRCLVCWDSVLASKFVYVAGDSSPFAVTTLQTKKGKGRLSSGRDARCDIMAGSPFSTPLQYAKTSKNVPILGCAHKVIAFSGGICGSSTARAGNALTAVGERTDGYILFDNTDQGTPPTLTGSDTGGVTDDGGLVAPVRNLRSR